MLAIQSELERNSAGFRKLPGTVLKNPAGEAVYLPPQDANTVLRLMGDLERFINAGEGFDADPLVKMALIHHQFESIHPFYDGNGRTGRIVNVLYLVKEGLLDLPILYLSRFIVRTKGDYYRLLQSVREDDAWEEWVLYMLTAVETTVMARANALRPCYDPHRLTAVVAVAARRMLAADDHVPVRAGPVWVIPQVRWLHEMERLNPLGHDQPRPGDLAPPLDFGLAGLPDWPGIRVADRLAGLRRHPLAMESERNRTVASTALLGAGGAGRERLDADLAIAGIGISPPLRLRHAARIMGAGGHGRQPGWLEVVLSWPHRFIGADPSTPSPADPDVRGIATG